VDAIARSRAKIATSREKGAGQAVNEVLAVVFAVTAATLPGGAAYEQGRAAESAARYGDAVALYDASAHADGPLAPYARIRSAVARSLAGDLDGGIRALEQLVATDADEPWAAYLHHELALLYTKAQRRADAVTVFQRAHASPIDIWWLEDIRWIAADTRIETPGFEPPGFAFFRDRAERSPWSKKRYTAARQLARSPDASERLVAALTLVRAGASDEAVPIVAPLEPFVLGKPDLEPAWMRAKGRIELVRGQPRTGIGRLLSLADRYPDSEHAHEGLNDLIGHHARRREFLQAERVLTQLRQIAPRSPQAVSARGALARAYVRADRLDDAAEHYLAIAQASPDIGARHDAVLDLAHAYRKTGRDREALGYYERIATEHPAGDAGVEAAYWSARLLAEASGIERDEVVNRLRQAATHGITNYYGYRAAQRLAELDDASFDAGRRLRFLGDGMLVRALDVESKRYASALTRLNGDDRIQRLAYFGERGYLEAEWEALTLGALLDGFSDPATYYLAMGEAGATAYTAMQFASAHGFGVEPDGTQTVERLRIRYPRAYWDDVRTLGRKLNLDPYLILSIARQETTYRPSLTSYAGAQGLMQVMPATAEWVVSKEADLDTTLLSDLHEPRNSLQLGAYYLRRMIDRYDGNVVYALAAYNGGPGNVDTWRRNYGDGSLEDFVETIPFTETRNYVKRVLAHYATYHSIYPAS